jgi:hypothetical protein
MFGFVEKHTYTLYPIPLLLENGQKEDIFLRHAT